MGLLDALLANESGGRNVANVDQGTSSGQAQGYFQITTGTWNDFGGQQYAPNPLAASYDQQADIASRIPLRRWDESTVAKMRATGLPVDPNKTLGENLAMNGESFAGRGGGGTAPTGTAVTSTPVSPAPARDNEPMQALADAFAMRDSLAAQETLPQRPQSLLADTLAQAATPSGTGGIVADATDQETAMVPYSESLAPSAVPETSAPAETVPQTDAAPTTGGLADLFDVKDIGISTELDPYTGQPRPYRPRRAYG